MIGLFLILVTIIYICYLISNNNELKKENQKLKNKRFCPNCGFNLFEPCNCNNNYMETNVGNIINNNQSFNYNNQILENNTKSITTKNKYTEKELKNSLILIVGSILIIISSIIFLTSTWNITHNILKTFIIILMLLVFFIASFIAEKYLNLKQTSKAFYYISLAYIPIALLSIALFSLFGKYFSLYGLGKYIYLSISSLLVSLIYYHSAKKRESKIITIFSIVFQLLALSFFILIFTNSTNLIYFGLLAYTLIFSLLWLKKYFYLDELLHKKVLNVLIISLTVIITENLLVKTFTNDINIIDCLVNVLLLINLDILLTKVSNKENIYNYIYPILILFSCYNLSLIISNTFIIKQLFLLLSFVIIYLYDIIKDNKINISSLIYINIFSIIIYIITIIYSLLNNELIIDTYLLMSIFSILNYITYLCIDKNKNIISYIFTTSLFFAISNIIHSSPISSIVIGYIIIGIIILSTIVKKENYYLKNPIINTGNTFICILTLFYLNTHINSYEFLIFSFLYTIFTNLYSTKNKLNIYKIISYIYLNIALYSASLTLNLDIKEYVIPITTIIIATIEQLTKEKNITINNYVIFQFIVSYLILNIYNNSLLSFILLIAISFIFYLFKNNNKSSNYYLYIMFLGILPYIELSNLLIFNNFNYMYIISCLCIILLILLIYNKKETLYINLFYIYSICHGLFLEEIKYITIILLIVGTFTSYLIRNNKTKDILKTFLYTLGLILYKFIIIDLGLEKITLLESGIYIIYLILVTRTIIKKYSENYKVLEYMISSLIYFIVLFNYTSEFDGIIFVFYLMILVIFCYFKKIGSIFLISLIFILINVLLLTRTFWLSIPWWIYILLMGITLVAFAVYNEMKLKKDNELKNKIINLKNNLDI